VNVEVRDAAVLRAVSPVDVLGYLRSAGWTEQHTVAGRESVWSHADDFEVVVPLSTELRDFAARVGDVLRVLQIAERRSELAILSDLVTTSADVIRIQLETFEAASGSIPLEEGVSLVERARDLLLAAASAAIDPRPSYGPKRPAQATDYVRGVRLGQTERGSYVVTLISKVTPDLAAHGQAHVVAEPFERRAVETLAKSVASTAVAAGQAIVSGDFNAFSERVIDGVSANLCDALVGMAGGPEARRDLSFHFSWARNRRGPVEQHQTIRLDSTAFPVIAEAARVFREITPEDEYTLFGPVVRLERQEWETSGRVTVLSFGEHARPRKVTLTLEADDYRAAVEAHDQKLPLVVVGTLYKEGRAFLLKNPHGVEVYRREEDPDN
jgi:hypothetical protein